MNVIKRNGKEVVFNSNKIATVIRKANEKTDELSEEQIINVINKALAKCRKFNRTLHVEEIQDIIEDALIQTNAYTTAKHFIKYRHQRELDRRQNTTDARILSTVNLENEDVKQENSNKNPVILPTQRDYIAGEVSKDITNRYFLPKDIQEGHNDGLLHFHDADYFVQREHNCDVWNLEDMLQNGTVINKTLIEKPHSFATACNIATQIMAQVASCQYGGQTITLSHLAPFVNESRTRIREDVVKDLAEAGISDISQE